MDPRPQVVQLGVQVTPTSATAMNVSLLYTDVNKHPSASNVLAAFSVPWRPRRYKRLSLRVVRDGVRLHDRCAAGEQTVAVTRDPTELLFDSASTLYIGQAGPLIKGAFDVSIRENIRATPPPPPRVPRPPGNAVITRVDRSPEPARITGGRKGRVTEWERALCTGFVRTFDVTLHRTTDKTLFDRNRDKSPQKAGNTIKILPRTHNDKYTSTVTYTIITPSGSYKSLRT